MKGNNNFEIIDMKNVTIKLYKVLGSDGEYILNQGIDVVSLKDDNTLSDIEKEEIIKELGSLPNKLLEVYASSNEDISCKLGPLFMSYTESLTKEERQYFKQELLDFIKETLDDYDK